MSADSAAHRAAPHHAPARARRPDHRTGRGRPPPRRVARHTPRAGQGPGPGHPRSRPRSELNPTSRWLVSLDDVEAELRRKGLLPPAAPAEPSIDAMRVQMLQGALNDENDRRIAALEATIADKDAEITRLRAQLAALGRAVEEQLAAAGRTVAAVTAG